MMRTYVIWPCKKLFPSFLKGAFFLAIIASCTEPPGEEVSRIPSPDGLVDAILIRKNVDATVATPYEICIVPTGSKVSCEALIRGDHFENLNIAWKEPQLLEISYSKGRIFNFTNFWQSDKVQNFKYIVELRLKPLSDRSID